MGEWLGPTVGARVRCETAVGALNKEDWKNRCEWAEEGKTLRILARMDAFGMKFPERSSGPAVVMIGINLNFVTKITDTTCKRMAYQLI